MITEVRKDGRLIAVYKEKLNEQTAKKLKKAGYKLKIKEEKKE